MDHQMKQFFGFGLETHGLGIGFGGHQYCSQVGRSAVRWSQPRHISRLKRRMQSKKAPFEHRLCFHERHQTPIDQIRSWPLLRDISCL